MFCKKCGSEIHDEAVICVKCGCQITQIAEVKPVSKEKEETSTTNAVINKFSFSTLSIIIALFVGLLTSLFYPNYIQIIFGTNYIIDSILVIVSFIFTIIVSITSLIFLLVNFKKEKETSVLTLILAIIINILMFVYCLTMFLLLVC